MENAVPDVKRVADAVCGTNVGDGVADWVEKYILDKIEERKKAKENKDYLLADKIREELLNKNIRLIDTKDNTTYEIINL